MYVNHLPQWHFRIVRYPSVFHRAVTLSRHKASEWPRTKVHPGLKRISGGCSFCTKWFLWISLVDVIIKNTQLLQLLTDRDASLGPFLCRHNRIPKGLSDAPTHQKLIVAIGEDRMTITQTVGSNQREKTVGKKGTRKFVEKYWKVILLCKKHSRISCFRKGATTHCSHQSKARLLGLEHFSHHLYLLKWASVSKSFLKLIYMYLNKYTCITQKVDATNSIPSQFHPIFPSHRSVNWLANLPYIFVSLDIHPGSRAPRLALHVCSLWEFPTPQLWHWATHLTRSNLLRWKNWWGNGSIWFMSFVKDGPFEKGIC